MLLTLHPQARTLRIRAELRAEDANLTDAKLARPYGVTPPTASKWRRREDIADRPPWRTLHCAMTSARDAVAMAVYQTLWLPLDDLLVPAQKLLNLAVPSYGPWCCPQPHGLNRPPMEGQDDTKRSETFKYCEPNFVRVDINLPPRMPDAPRRRYLFVATDRATCWA